MNVRRVTVLTLVIAGAALIAAGAIPAQTQNPGAAEFVLEGGTSGKVPFPHRRHQQADPDCTVCHSRFPQKAGAIEELKEKGTLPRKQVMNELCTKCHKERQAAGQSSGPVTCTKCHVKG
jgi:cytochrome c-type protein NrfB